MKNDEQKKRGIIIGLLFALCDSIFAAFRSGIVFGLISSHKDDKEVLESSAICCGFGFFAGKCRRATESIKKFIARQFERSFMLRCFSSALVRLVNIPGRVLGAFGVTWGAYVILINLIKRYALYVIEESGVDLVVGVVAFIASLPLLFTDKSICCTAKESWLISAILYKVFGIPDETLKSIIIKKPGQSGAVILGILLGLATYFISPLDMIAGAFAFTVFVLVLSYPEGGVLISVAISPLLGLIDHSSKVLAAFVLLTAFSYFLKVLRGKRVFKIGLTDLAVYAFMSVILISGFAPGEANTFQNALVCCSLMLIFPLIVNLMVYRHWINACIVAFVVPSALVAFIGIAQYFLGFAPSGWVDVSLFSSITQRTVSVFNNPNILGVYLAAMFPMALMLTMSRFERKVRILGGIIASYIVISTILTYSRSAWLALIAGAVLFAVTISPRGILWLVPAGLATVALALIFPDTVGVRLLNFVSISDSANNYRIDVWNSSWRLLSDTYWFGIGWGEEAFRNAYINYGSQGTQYAMHSHSLYLQIAIQTGIVGLAVFTISVFTVIRKCFSIPGDTKSHNALYVNGKAAISGAVAIMIAGVFDYTWYNFRVFFVFWALLAFACAVANINRKEDSLWVGEADDNYSFITVSIPSLVDKHVDNK